MKYTWISALAMLLAVPRIGLSQTDSSRLTTSGVPIAGDSLTIHYQPAGGPLAGKEHVYGLVYTYRNYQWGLDDILLKKNNSSWDGVYVVPANCALIAMKFIAEEDGKVVASDNNNDHGFVETTLDN